MQTTLMYGKDGLTIDIPEHAVVLEPKENAGLADEEQGVLAALRNPIGTLPLNELVKPTDKIVIVISDITRPTPNDKLIPWILKELPHVPLDQITILNGTGTHRDQTHEEFGQGEYVAEASAL